MLSHNDSVAFQYFLDNFNEGLKNRRIVMIMDNASWHKSKKLNWGNITPVYLPPYSPELNPIEELWKLIKDRLCDPTPAKTRKEHQDRIIIVLKELFKDKAQIRSTCKLSRYRIS